MADAVGGQKATLSQISPTRISFSIGHLLPSSRWPCWRGRGCREPLRHSGGASYTGRKACQPCHPKQYASYIGSHHDLAMDPAGDETVLGDFEDATLTHFGVTSRFYRRDGKFLV